MASQLYPKGAKQILDGNIDFLVDDIKVLFYISAYNAAHEFYTDLTGGSIVATSGVLTGKATNGPSGSTPGTFDATNITITAVSGSAFTHVVLFKDTGTPGTSPLIAIFDVASFTPNGGDVNVVFHASGLFGIV